MDDTASASCETPESVAYLSTQMILKAFKLSLPPQKNSKPRFNWKNLPLKNKNQDQKWVKRLKIK